jgi:thiamine-monophosphate kinase
VDIKEIGESGLIQRIADRYRSSHPAIISGIGDDAAAVSITAPSLLLATSDLLIEGIHFNLSSTDSYHLGWKSLAVNLSDIAAMGGTPRFFLVSLALPPHLQVEFIDDLYRGMIELATKFNTQLVGGDTNASPDKLMIAITLLGEAHPDHLLTRSGAQVGDSLYVTGTLGDAALGLHMIEKESKSKKARPPHQVILKHLAPYPRIQEGKALAAHQLASAMIDISDGLCIDLQRMLTLSGVGATIRLSRLPLSKQFREYQNHHPHDTIIDFALSGGEDYELLFTSPPVKERKLLRCAKTWGGPLSKIGVITSSKGLVVLDQDKKPYHVDVHGYDHFSSPKRTSKNYPKRPLKSSIRSKS